MEREEEEEPKKKNAHRRIQRITGWVAPVFSFASYTGNTKEGSIILASMLWSQNTNTYSFVCFHVCFHLLICSWSKSQSFYTLNTCVCPSTEKGRFVVVLSSHLRCSPFKRHKFSYKLCDCECAGRGVLRRKGGPCTPTPPPLQHSLFAQWLHLVTLFASTFCSTVAAGLSSGKDCSF